MKEPIMEFKDIEQAQTYLKEWQERLFLTDWIIKIEIASQKDMSDDERGGEVFMTQSLKTAYVRLLEGVDYPKEIIKHCHEKVLVHELLHLKYNVLDHDNSYEGVYINEIEHQLLEQMAKSLIMAKYNLPFEWFKNF